MASLGVIYTMSKTHRPTRSGEAVAAQHRNAGYMKHRNQPRGGTRNRQAEYLDDAGDEFDWEG